MATRTLTQVNKDISEQMSKIYDLLEKKSNPEFIKIEYKAIVDLISEKYALLVAEAKKQKRKMSKKQQIEVQKNLEQQYKDDLISIAVGIDETIEQYSK